MDDLVSLWESCRPAFSQQRCWEKAGRLVFGNLINFGRHTIAGSITSSGGHSHDWSAIYRLFERQRFETDRLFDVPRQAVVAALQPGSPVIASLDDTLLRKTGQTVHGTSWKRDPLGPKFSTNFTWAQRWLQISLNLPESNGRCRAIPVDFQHCPCAVKPKKNANADELTAYKKQQKELALPLQATKRMLFLRQQISAERKLIFSGDGGYTNRTVCRNLPENTSLLGRIRKDAKLFSVPDKTDGRGRKRIYGEQLPTPEAIRQDDSIPWHEVNAATGDKMHTFKIKTIHYVRSQLAGDKDLKLIIVQPLRYRLTKNSKLLYRNPAYIISTDQDIKDADILQWYLWRWEIELNFREEKSILGLNEAMVRTPQAVAAWAPFVVNSYSMLLLAGRNAIGEKPPMEFMPKWQKTNMVSRPSTNHYLSVLRKEIAGMSWKINFDGFREQHNETLKQILFIPDMNSAMLHARK